MNKLLIEFMRENELSDDLLWKKAAVLIVMYFVGRINGNLSFKKNKFNEYWNN